MRHFSPLACNGHITVSDEGTMTIEELIAYLIHDVRLPVQQPARSFGGPQSTVLSYQLQLGSLSRPLNFHLPSIRPVTHNTCSAAIDTLFACLSVENIVTLTSHLLVEQKLLFHSHSFSRLIEIQTALMRLLYPMQWFYASIPLLTCKMLDALDIPQPFLVGMHSQLFKSSDCQSIVQSMNDLIVIDIDHDCVTMHDDLQSSIVSMPDSVQLTLFRRLKACKDRAVAKLDVSVDRRPMHTQACSAELAVRLAH